MKFLFVLFIFSWGQAHRPDATHNAAVAPDQPRANQAVVTDLAPVYSKDPAAIPGFVEVVPPPKEDNGNTPDPLEIARTTFDGPDLLEASTPTQPIGKGKGGPGHNKSKGDHVIALSQRPGGTTNLQDLSSLRKRWAATVNKQEVDLARRKWSETLKEQAQQKQAPPHTSYDHPSWLASCQMLYIDVGSNIGVQIKKFFEPSRFPGSPAEPLFDEMFGSAEHRNQKSADNGICVLGIEANRQHQAELEKFANASEAIGLHVHFYFFAVGTSEGDVAFGLDDPENDPNQLRAQVISDESRSPNNIEKNAAVTRGVDFVDFLLSMPEHTDIKLVKFDIEGAEWQVLPALAKRKLLCNDVIQAAYMEIYPELGDVSSWNAAQTEEGVQAFLGEQACPTGATKMSFVHDQKYEDGIPAPQTKPERSKGGQLNNSVDYGHPDWLAFCQTIYLDLGSNTGAQIKKLFEPAQFPGSTALPLFDEAFGSIDKRSKPSSLSGLCALGMEANPEHKAGLQQLADDYKMRGWNVHFYSAAASSSDGQVKFGMENNTGLWKKIGLENPKQWGANEQMSSQVVTGEKYVPERLVKTAPVQAIDMAAFVDSLPAHSIKLMKVDIEGGEWQVLPRLAQTHALCKGVIDAAYVELHVGWGDTHLWTDTQDENGVKQFMAHQTCPNGKQMALNFVDDESYGDGQPATLLEAMFGHEVPIPSWLAGLLVLVLACLVSCANYGIRQYRQQAVTKDGLDHQHEPKVESW